MNKAGYLNIYLALFIFLAALTFLSIPAQAYVYDDFTSAGIDPGLWVDRGPDYGLFSQPGDGYLYFNDLTGGQVDGLISHDPINGAFSVEIQYSDFQVNNPGGAYEGATVYIGMGDNANSFVSISGWENSLAEGFQADLFTGGSWTTLNYVVANSESGRLKLQYNGVLGPGGKVDFFFDSGTGWTWLASCNPNFTQAPWITIQGQNLHGLRMSFLVHSVYISPPNIAPINNLLLDPDP